MNHEGSKIMHSWLLDFHSANNAGLCWFLTHDELDFTNTQCAVDF